LFARAHEKIIARPNDFGNRKQESFTAEDTENGENGANGISCEEAES